MNVVALLIHRQELFALLVTTESWGASVVVDANAPWERHGPIVLAEMASRWQRAEASRETMLFKSFEAAMDYLVANHPGQGSKLLAEFL